MTCIQADHSQIKKLIKNSIPLNSRQHSVNSILIISIDPICLNQKANLRDKSKMHKSIWKNVSIVKVIQDNRDIKMPIALTKIEALGWLNLETTGMINILSKTLFLIKIGK